VLTVCHLIGRTATPNQRTFNSCYLHEKQLLPKPRVVLTRVLCLKEKGTAMRTNKKLFRQNLIKITITSRPVGIIPLDDQVVSQHRVLSTKIPRSKRANRSSSQLRCLCIFSGLFFEKVLKSRGILQITNGPGRHQDNVTLRKRALHASRRASSVCGYAVQPLPWEKNPPCRALSTNYTKKT